MVIEKMLFKYMTISIVNNLIQHERANLMLFRKLL